MHRLFIKPDNNNNNNNDDDTNNDDDDNNDRNKQEIDEKFSPSQNWFLFWELGFGDFTVGLVFKKLLIEFLLGLFFSPSWQHPKANPTLAETKLKPILFQWNLTSQFSSEILQENKLYLDVKFNSAIVS